VETNKKLIPLLTLFILLFLPLIQFIENYNYLIHILLFGFLYITLSSSWNIIGGYGGFISVGHNVFFGIGAFFSGFIFVRYDISPFLTALLAGVVASIFGFGVGLITLRVKGPSFIISSIALLMIFRILFDRWELVGAAHGMTLPHNNLPVEWSKVPHYFALLILMVLSVYLSWFIRHSKFGLALRSISHDEIKSAVTGINVKMVKVTAFALSAYFIGAAGAIWGDYLTYVRPNIFFIILIAANMVLMCILGGKGTVTGPIIGTILMIFFNEFILAQFGASELNIFLTGLLLILTLLYFPDGIVGSLKKRNLLPKFLDWG
jgi:branched-chain amino acid transport system permease protein|tara:strand:+ start:177 stop:1136 length:960 start_codon:yes stop_codon:yes gene_type:complete